MTDKKKFILAHSEARRRAVQAVSEAPTGYAVTVAPPTRNLEQNAMLWSLLECFSKQLKWPINGELVTLEPEEFKDILSAAWKQETVRLAAGLNGGMVMLGLRTSKLNKAQFADFIEFILSVAAERGICTTGKDSFK